MKNNIFFILNGNNGASYICNTKNWQSIDESLKFYKARTLKSQVLKQGLKWYLLLNRFFFSHKFKDANSINTYLQQVSSTKTDFNIHDDCSILISPTNDKVIVNHHHSYFQKFAFGNSYQKVKKEASIYNLLPTTLTHFQVSRYFDAEVKPDEFMSFKLSNEGISTNKKELTINSLVPVLIEFFKGVPVTTCRVNDYIENLQKKLLQLTEGKYGAQEQVLEQIKSELGNVEFPQGLVHRDFKPWNLLHYKKPLLFDFEEAIVNGPPLEDLLNYLIDPIIRYRNASEVAKILFNNHNMKVFASYLKALDIKIEPQIFIHFYVIERMLFWHHNSDMLTTNKYKHLSDYLITQNNAL